MANAMIEKPPATAKLLQSNLADLIALGLHAKQAHWNIVGPRFLPLHEFYDRINADAITFQDETAERIRQIGGFPNGNLDEVSEAAVVEPMPTGRIADEESILLISHRLRQVVAAMRERLPKIEEADVVTADMVHAHIHTLESHLWMLSSSSS